MLICEPIRVFSKRRLDMQGHMFHDTAISDAERGSIPYYFERKWGL